MLQRGDGLGVTAKLRPVPLQCHLPTGTLCRTAHSIAPASLQMPAETVRIQIGSPEAWVGHTVYAKLEGQREPGAERRRQPEK
jgi:hypothetical protein